MLPAVCVDIISQAVGCDDPHADKIIGAVHCVQVILQIRERGLSIHSAPIPHKGGCRFQGLQIPLGLRRDDVLILGHDLLHILLGFPLLGAPYAQIDGTAGQNQDHTDDKYQNHRYGNLLFDVLSVHVLPSCAVQPPGHCLSRKTAIIIPV